MGKSGPDLFGTQAIQIASQERAQYTSGVLRIGEERLTRAVLMLLNPMWGRRKQLKRLEEELMSINLFERLYQDRSNPVEADQQAHVARELRRTKLSAEIEKLRGLSK